MSEEIHPKEQPDERDRDEHLPTERDAWLRRNDDPVRSPFDREESGELFGNEGGGQEP